MNVYVYQAALLCEDCGLAACEELKSCAPEDPSDEGSYDSDDYPAGPYANGGGEADSPQHCDECGAFLENPLTHLGLDLLVKSIAEHLTHGVGSADVLLEWAEFYDLNRLDDLFEVVRERFRGKRPPEQKTGVEELINEIDGVKQ